MKTILKILISFLAINMNAQEIVPDYIPERNEGVSEEDYNRGKYYLQNTYLSMKELKRTTYVDYWNIGTAYSYMGQSPEIILSFFSKSKSLDSEFFCDVIARSFEDVNEMRQHRLYRVLGIELSQLISDCDLSLRRESLESRMKEKDEINLNGLDEELIDKLILLMDKDQYYRYSNTSYTENWDKQNKLDAEVSYALIEIFDKYGYPGKKLVGEKFMNYGCLLLEHGSPLETQEYYFPLVIKALKEDEVKKPGVRMLIDRIHWKKTGKQIFGSHGKIPFDDGKIIQEYKKNYDL